MSVRGGMRTTQMCVLFVLGGSRAEVSKAARPVSVVASRERCLQSKRRIHKWIRIATRERKNHFTDN